MIGSVTSLALPVLVPGVALIAILKAGWFSALRKPIDGGAMLGRRPLFGQAKTWLGVIVYVGGGALIGALTGLAPWSDAVYQRVPGAVVGIAAGALYVTGELANSFVKRRLGIASSESASGVRGQVQWFFDLVDGAVLACLGFLALGVAPGVVVVTFVVGAALHALAEFVMHAIGVKRRA